MAEVVVIGGTGTLGRAIVNTLNKNNKDTTILILSRDEQKQAVMRREYGPNVSFALGDVTREDSLDPYLRGASVVFHVAALKHVDIVEENVHQAMLTNYFGVVNAYRACDRAGVKHLVFSSTDKAVDPINAYGFSKAAAEKFLFSANAQSRSHKLRASVYRWGNVIGSTGSVIPYFVKTLIEEKTAYITDLGMTRYWIPIEWAVNYMLFTYKNAKEDTAMIPTNMKCAPVVDVIGAIADILDISGHKVTVTGIRAGEKLHETMISEHAEYCPDDSRSDEKYTRDELISLLTPIVNREAKR